MGAAARGAYGQALFGSSGSTMLSDGTVDTAFSARRSPPAQPRTVGVEGARDEAARREGSAAAGEAAGVVDVDADMVEDDLDEPNGSRVASRRSWRVDAARPARRRAGAAAVEGRRARRDRRARGSLRPLGALEADARMACARRRAQGPAFKVGRVSGATGPSRSSTK